MKDTIVYQKISESKIPQGYYYAHIPALDITTHGLGIEGAKEAALDLIKLWIEERIANGGKGSGEIFRKGIVGRPGWSTYTVTTCGGVTAKTISVRDEKITPLAG